MIFNPLATLDSEDEEDDSPSVMPEFNAGSDDELQVNSSGSLISSSGGNGSILGDQSDNQKLLLKVEQLMDQLDRNKFKLLNQKETIEQLEDMLEDREEKLKAAVGELEQRNQLVWDLQQELRQLRTRRQVADVSTRKSVREMKEQFQAQIRMSTPTLERRPSRSPHPPDDLRKRDELKSESERDHNTPSVTCTSVSGLEVNRKSSSAYSRSEAEADADFDGEEADARVTQLRRQFDQDIVAIRNEYEAKRNEDLLRHKRETDQLQAQLDALTDQVADLTAWNFKTAFSVPKQVPKLPSGRPPALPTKPVPLGSPRQATSTTGPATSSAISPAPPDENELIGGPAYQATSTTSTPTFTTTPTTTPTTTTPTTTTPTTTTGSTETTAPTTTETTATNTTNATTTITTTTATTAITTTTTTTTATTTGATPTATVTISSANTMALNPTSSTTATAITTTTEITTITATTTTTTTTTGTATTLAAFTLLPTPTPNIHTATPASSITATNTTTTTTAAATTTATAATATITTTTFTTNTITSATPLPPALVPGFSTLRSVEKLPMPSKSPPPVLPRSPAGIDAIPSSISSAASVSKDVAMNSLLPVDETEHTTQQSASTNLRAVTTCPPSQLLIASAETSIHASKPTVPTSTVRVLKSRPPMPSKQPPRVSAREAPRSRLTNLIAMRTSSEKQKSLLSVLLQETLSRQMLNLPSREMISLEKEVQRLNDKISMLNKSQKEIQHKIDELMEVAPPDPEQELQDFEDFVAITRARQRTRVKRASDVFQASQLNSALAMTWACAACGLFNAQSQTACLSCGGLQALLPSKTAPAGSR